MPTYSGIRATDRAPVSTRFRATWTRGFFSRGWLFPPSAVSAVTAVQTAGPGRGFYVISAPAASPEADTIVLDVKTQSSWQGTAADLATALDAVIGGTFDLSALKLIPTGESQSAGAADRDKVQTAAEKQADENTLAHTAADTAKDFLKGIRSTVLLAAVAALAIAALVYAPQLKAAGRAVKRAIK